MEQAALILSGKTKELTEELTEKMLSASDELKFELAASYRDRIRAVEGLGNRQRVISAVYADTDAVMTGVTGITRQDAHTAAAIAGTTMASAAHIARIGTIGVHMDRRRVAEGSAMPLSHMAMIPSCPPRMTGRRGENTPPYPLWQEFHG